MKSPHLSIVIRSRNEGKYIQDTLDAVLDQDISGGIEVIVVDSGSTDDTLVVARRFQCRILAIEPDRFTFGYALNYGARHARGDYVVNLSAHCVPADRSWLSHLLRPFERDASIAATYGRQLPVKGVNPFEERILLSLYPAEPRSVRPPFSNANCAIRREVWERHNFDETAPFAEDRIWSASLPDRLQIEYVPEGAVYHSHPLSLGYWCKRFYQSGLAEAYALNVPMGTVPPAGPSASAGVGRHVEDFREGLDFLWAQGYGRRIPSYLVYFALERYFYRKGLRHGRRRYRLDPGPS